MKVIKYKVIGYTDVWNPETEEVEQKECLAGVECLYTEAAYQKALETAYNGKVTIEEVPDEPVAPTTAPYNIVTGEYVTIDGVLYLATENIPNGEPVIVGQNAVKTTVEDQLRELKGE